MLQSLGWERVRHEWAAEQQPQTWNEPVSEVAQLCPTLCDAMDCSLPVSSVHGIFQAIGLEWIAISFSRGYLFIYLQEKGVMLKWH